MATPTRALAPLLALLLAAPAEAGHRHKVQAGQPAPDCTCRAQGKRFELGETICLPTSEGPRVAVCVLEINVTSWRMSRVPCPDS